MSVGPGWAFRSVSAVATGTVSLTITAPAGIVDDDILVLKVAHKGAGFGTVPAGFSLVERALQGATRGEMYWKRAVSESGSYSVTGLGTVAAGFITAYAGGLAAGQVVHVSSVRSNASGAKGTTGVTPTITHGLVVIMAALSTNVAPTSLGNDAGDVGKELLDHDLKRLYRRQDGGSATGGGVRIASADGIKIVASATGDIEWFAPANPENVGILAVFIPEPIPSMVSGTRYYFTSKSTGVHVSGRLAGHWHSTHAQPQGWALEPRTNRLEQLRGEAGEHHDLNMFVNQQGNYDVCVGRWLTPPLVEQTIAGTVDLRWFIGAWWEDFTLGRVDSSVVRTKLHVYITKGQTAAVRLTLLRAHVETVNWPFDTGAASEVKGLVAPEALTSALCQRGDSVMVELGYRIVSSPTPAPHYPPDEWTGITIDGFGATNPLTSGLGSPSTHAGVPELDQVIGVDDGTKVAHLLFSQYLVESAEVPTPPAHSTIATAKVITDADLPYCDGPFDTTGSLVQMREVWYEYTPLLASTVDDEDGGYQGATRLGLFAYGTNHNVKIDVFYDVSGLNLTPTNKSFEGVLDSAGGAAVHRAQESRWFDVTAARRYWIRVRCFQETGGTAASAGGAVQLTVIRERAPREDDIYLSTAHTLALDQCGNLVNGTSAFESSVPTGIGIDYSLRLMADLSASSFPALTHQRPRLFVGVHAFKLVEIVDLATLNKGHGEVDFIAAVYSSPTNSQSAQLLFTHDTSKATRYQGLGDDLLVSWFGDGYQHVSGAPPLPAFLNNVSNPTPNAEQLRRHDALEGDNQPGAPFADAEAFDLAVEHTSPHHIALDRDNRTLYYTSGGHYLASSQIAGVTTDLRATLIKRWDLTTASQLADLTPLALVPGFNPGLRGLVVLPGDKGLLVCNGSQVQWVTLTGRPVRSYVPTPVDKAQCLISLAITSDGERFWVYDAESAALFQFNICSGAQERCVETYQVAGGNSQLTMYQPNGIAEPCW